MSISEALKEEFGWMGEVRPRTLQLEQSEKLVRDAFKRAEQMEKAYPLLVKALKRSLPAAWLAATSGNPDAVAIHREIREALEAAGEDV